MAISDLDILIRSAICGGFAWYLIFNNPPVVDQAPTRDIYHRAKYVYRHRATRISSETLYIYCHTTRRRCVLAPPRLVAEITSLPTLLAPSDTVPPPPPQSPARAMLAHLLQRDARRSIFRIGFAVSPSVLAIAMRTNFANARRQWWPAACGSPFVC